MTHHHSINKLLNDDGCRGFAEDAVEEPDEDDEEESGGKGKKSADADLINIAQEKMMAEEASKYNIGYPMHGDSLVLFREKTRRTRNHVWR